MIGNFGKFLKSVEELGKEAKRLESRIEEPEKVYDILKFMVESHAGAIPSEMYGMARNAGVEMICTQLQKLQEELIFQDKYKVVYVKD